MILSLFLCFRLVPSSSEIRGPHYKSPWLPTSTGWPRPSIRKKWSLIYSRDLLLSFALSAFFQKRPNKPWLSRGDIRTAPSKMQNNGFCVAPRNSMPLRLRFVLVTTSCQHLESICPFQKATQTELPVTRMGPSDVVWGRMGRDPCQLGGIGSEPDYPIRRDNLSWGHKLNRGEIIFFLNNLTLAMSVKALRKILELLGAFLNLCFGRYCFYFELYL